jgi:penicillin-binding protein 2
LLHNSGHTGAAVAIDPTSGEILCLASYPTFDQSVFAGGISKEDWARLRDDPTHPMLNRAISTALQPGSTFKIVTTLAAYESGHFNANQTYFCAGGLDVGNRFIKCLGHHGSIDYRNALAKSCNVYFYNLAKLCGEDALRKAAAELGLGQQSGIEIGPDSKGTIPTEEFIQRFRKPPKWFLGDTMNFAIGQGFVATTPIQMANMVAQVANNGVRYKPHLVREIRDYGSNLPAEPVKPEVVSNVQATSEFWSELHAALEAVVTKGTASGARLDGISLAGKTGSAEHGSRKDSSGHFEKKTHAWFVGYAPTDQPKIAVCVLLEDAGHGGDVAAPVARDLLNHYFNVTLKASVKRTASASSASAFADSPTAR